MTDLQFDTQSNEFGRPPAQQSGFDLSGKLVAWGLVSSRDEATYVLLAIGVLALGAAVFIFMSSSGSTPPPPPISG